MGVSADIVNGQIVNNGIRDNTDITKAIEASKKESGGALDKDAFLQLLVTQMQYQDPLEPTDNTQYISQLASFSTLEQMQNMSATMEMQRASGLVGQYVYIEETDATTGETKQVEGTVDYVTYSGSKTYLSINGKLYNFDDLVTVADADYTLAVKLADSIVSYINKLPDLSELSEEDADDVKKLAEAYGNMDSYQKSFLTDEEKAVADAYLSWYNDHISKEEDTKEDENNADNNNEGAVEDTTSETE